MNGYPRSTRRIVTGLFLASAISTTACTRRTYEGTAVILDEESSETRTLDGVQLRLYWPVATAIGSSTLLVEYESVLHEQPQLEQQATRIWEILRSEAERKSVQRVALRPTIIEKGLNWRDGWPSLWRSSTLTFWRVRSRSGQWVAGDPRVEDR